MCGGGGGGVCWRVVGGSRFCCGGGVCVVGGGWGGSGLPPGSSIVDRGLAGCGWGGFGGRCMGGIVGGGSGRCADRGWAIVGLMAGRGFVVGSYRGGTCPPSTPAYYSGGGVELIDLVGLRRSRWVRRSGDRR